MYTAYNYDLFVIGGGSGGLSCARQAAKLGAKVGLADFVKPSNIGTKWGIGGTCVNVGCIPKKLFHTASMWSELRNDQKEAGFEIDTEAKIDWSNLVGKIQMHIKKLNFGYTSNLMKENVEYINSLASFVDGHTLLLTDQNGKATTVTAKYIVIAVGGRPSYPSELKGGESYIMTSDDIFSLKKPPGKTLMIGASYVSLECGGYLAGLGFDITIMVRSILLRGFD